MTTLDLFQTMSRYNRWMNEKMYAICEAIPDNVRREDKGAPFRSIHGTLNHLLLTDKAWLGRFLQQPFAFQSLSQELFYDFAELRHEREATDERLHEYFYSLSEAAVAEPFTFTNSQGKTLTLLLGHLLLHVGNHQTHHRGQLTTLLEQSGFDCGVTDLPLLPGLKLS